MNPISSTEDRKLTPAGQRILDVASDLFYRHGIRAVGVDMIAREANVTKKTIYDRFGSKDELVRTYLTIQDREWHDLIEEHVVRPELEPRDRILAMFDIMKDRIRARGCGFINAHAEFSDSDHPAIELARGQKTWFKGFFTSLARDAGAPDPESLGSQLLMLHEGAYVAYAMADQIDAAQQARDAAAVLLNATLSPR